MKKLAFILFAAGGFLYSCSRQSTTGAANMAPSDLTVNAVVATDSSGNVSFTATAVNALTYDFDFGNGVLQHAASGKITYRYTVSGSYTITVIAKGTDGQTTARSIQVPVGVRLSLVWHDEFDTAGPPASSRWGYDIGGNGWGNNELEYYTSRIDNAVVSNGTLKIVAKKEQYSGSAYTSARLLTRNKFAFTYGKIEVRAKLTADGGTWPAIWMLGNNIATVSWPACGEIDIMEYVGNQPGKIFGTIHYPGHSGAGGVGGTTMNSTVTTDFHRYALLWSPAALSFMIDDVVYFSTPNNSSMPFNQDFFIILNLAIGGNFGGPVDPAFTSAQMEIDYVRVYQ